MQCDVIRSQLSDFLPIDHGLWKPTRVLEISFTAKLLEDLMADGIAAHLPVGVTPLFLLCLGFPNFQASPVAS